MRYGLAIMSLGVGTMTSALAGTATFSYTEPLRRAWQHEALSFQVKVPKPVTDLTGLYVTAESGVLVPAQFSDLVVQAERNDNSVTVTVLADLQPWQERTWTLHYGEPTPAALPGTDLQAAEEKGCYVLTNAKVAVRVPRGVESFPRPAAAADVPAPIQAVRGPAGKWLGHGWLESPQRITGYRATLTHDGPLFKRVRLEYAFTGGRYVCLVTLRTGEDVVHLREEFDLGEPTKERDSNFCFSLKEGLAPDTVRWYGRYYDKRYNVKDIKPNTDTEAEFPVDYAAPGRLLRLHGLFVWWPEAASYWGAYNQANPQSDLVAVFPERPGHWRNPAAVMLETQKGNDLILRFPLRQPEQDWVIDGVDYLSPYWTGTVHPGTPRTLGVREWGLLVTRAADAIPAKGDIATSGIRKAWTRYGQNPLDKLKDWVLNWPDPGPEVYPRGAMSAAELPALRERTARIPALKGLLGNPQYKRYTYLIQHDPKLADELTRAPGTGLLPLLRASAACYLDTQGDLGNRTFMHHGNFHLMAAAPTFDVVMSMSELTPEERREARALYAFLLYKISDPDWLAYGAGFHLGNPNMATMSMSTIGSSAALIPEHPKASEWMMNSARSTLDMLRDYTAPGGAWRECPHYQMDASMIGVLQAAALFRNAGFLDLCQNPFLKATMLYHAQLLTPVDPRFGIRTMPAIGNGCYEATSLYGRMAAGVAKSDPQYAKWLQWAWKATGTPYMYPNDELILNEDLPAEAPDLSSRHFPGFGAVMRAHVGDPNETYLLFRMGYQHEHYEDDQGEIVLYSRGAPLLMDFGSQYQPMMARPWLHNRVSLNHMTNWHAVGEVTRQNFLNAADAALGRITYDQMFPIPEDPLTPTPPNAGPPPVPFKEPVTWTRQVLLVKHEQADAPHYVLLRDSFEGQGDDFNEFSLWGLATGVQTQGNRANYAGQHGVDIAVTVLDPVKPEFTTGTYGHTNCGPSLGYWRKMNGDKPYAEVQQYIRLKRTDHQGYFAVIYPHRPNEAVPAFVAWAGGAGVTAEVAGERHVVLCAAQPGRYQDGAVSVDGQRAVVRFGKERTVLVLLDAAAIAAAGYTLAASGPVAVTIGADGITAEANLPAAGTLCLTLPAANPALKATLQSNDHDQPLTMIWEGTTLKLALPKGKSQLAIR